MRSHAFEVVLALGALAVGNGFIGQVSSSSQSMLRMSASPSSGLDGTRGDMIKTASAAIAGVLASTAILPGEALAAAKPDPNRKGKRAEPSAARCACMQIRCRFSVGGQHLSIYGVRNQEREQQQHGLRLDWRGDSSFPVVGVVVSGYQDCRHQGTKVRTPSTFPLTNLGLHTPVALTSGFVPHRCYCSSP